MSTAVQYRFAKGGDGSTIEIGELDPETRAARGPFVCFGCGGPLIARMGRQIAWHFAHARHAVCVAETQLHRLAKQLFYETYARCLERREPYNLFYAGRTACSRSEPLGELRCTVGERRAIDLTQYYDRVDMEGRVGRFVADVLLSSSKSAHVLLVEIAVSHPCDAEKIAHGPRIVEISVSTEEGARSLREPALDATAGSVKTYNFGTTLHYADACGGECLNEVDVFTVYSSGKARLEHTTAARAAAQEPKANVVYQVVRSDAMDVDLVKSWNFRAQVFKAYSRGVDIKNCFLCRYQGESEERGRIFCRAKREHLQSNSAADCDRYRPSMSRRQAEVAQAEIDAEHQANNDFHLEVRLR